MKSLWNQQNTLIETNKLLQISEYYIFKHQPQFCLVKNTTQVVWRLLQIKWKEVYVLLPSKSAIVQVTYPVLL